MDDVCGVESTDSVPESALWRLYMCRLSDVDVDDSHGANVHTRADSSQQCTGLSLHGCLGKRGVDDQHRFLAELMTHEDRV